MELKRYTGILWKWAWMIALSVILAASFSYIATAGQPKLYQAVTRIIVGQSYLAANPNPQDFQTSAALAATYVEIAKTTPVLQNALDKLGYPLSSDALKERLHVNVVPNTQLIEVRVDDTDPQHAQALANELAYQLILQGPAARQEPQQTEFIQKQVVDVQQKIVAAQKNIADLQSQIQVTLSARDIATKQQQISQLDNQVAQWQLTFAQLQALLAPRSPNFLSIVDSAQLPTKPYAPNVTLNVLLAAAVGLILSLGATLLIEYLDDSLKHPDDVTQSLGLPLLGSLARINEKQAPDESELLPHTPTGSNEDAGDTNTPENLAAPKPINLLGTKLVTLNSSRSAQAEAYRVLRTNLQFNSVDKPLHSILVTSALSGEGKSLTAANLAIVMAQAGWRTILIDADLRKPSLHRLFGLPNSEGLTDSLLSPTFDPQFIRRTGVDCLSILTTGALPPNPAELLGSKRMHDLNEHLHAQADIVIFDGPPCLPVTDPAVLASLVDGVILVVDMTQTRRKDAQRAKEILSKVGARILGVALNRVQPSKSNYYYTYDYAPNGRKRKNKTKPSAS